MVYFFVFIVLAGIVVTAPISFYKAREWQYFATCIKFQDLNFRFNITGWGFMLFAMGNNLMIYFTLGLATPYIYTRYIRYFEERPEYQGDAEALIVEKSTEEGPTRGEGLADVFDVGGI